MAAPIKVQAAAPRKLNKELYVFFNFEYCRLRHDGLEKDDLPLNEVRHQQAILLRIIWECPKVT